MKTFRKLMFDWLKCAIEILMLSLILCMVTVLTIGEPKCYIWVALLVVYSLVGLLIHRLFWKAALADYFLCFVVSFIMSFVFGKLLGGGIGVIVAMGILGTLAAVRARMIASKPWAEASPSYIYQIMMVINLVITLIIGAMPALERFRPIATVLGPIIVLSGLLTMNQLNLLSLTGRRANKGSAGKMAVTKAMSLYNKLLIVGIFVIILILSSFTGVINALKKLANLFYNWLLSLSRFFDSGDGARTSTDGTDKIEIIDGIESTGVTNFQEIIMRIAVVIAIILFAAFIIFVLTKGIKKLLQFLKNVKFKGDVDDEGADEYDDTRESLVDLADLPGQYLKRMREWLADQFEREPPWSSWKTVSEKVRALYRRAAYRGISGGLPYTDCLSPKDLEKKLPDYLKTVDKNALSELIDDYEIVRYGEREPDAAGVEALNQKI